MRSKVELKTGMLLLERSTRTSEETQAVGALLAAGLEIGDIVCVSGELGAGKTTFIQGVCRSLGVTEAVTSPTFTLINEYRGRFPIFHFDFYRIKSEDEALELGIEDYFNAGGVCLLEWPERIYGLLPMKFIWVKLEWNTDPLDENRVIKVYKHE